MFDSVIAKASVKLGGRADDAERLKLASVAQMRKEMLPV